MAFEERSCHYDNIYISCLWYNFPNYGRARFSLGKIKRLIP